MSGKKSSFKRDLIVGGLALLMLVACYGVLIHRQRARRLQFQQQILESLAGEWCQSPDPGDRPDALAAWSFRPDGTIQVNVISRKSRESTGEPPLLGRWWVEDEEVVCHWEVWNGGEPWPARGEEAEERFSLRTLSEKEMVLRMVKQRGKPVAGEETLRYERRVGSGPK